MRLDRETMLAVWPAVMPPAEISSPRPRRHRLRSAASRQQAGGQVHRADLGAVAELQHGGDQADGERSEQLVDVVLFRIIDVSDEETRS